MSIPLSALDDIDVRDLITWMRPTPVDTAQGEMMLAAAVEMVKEAVRPRTEVSGTAKGVVLEAAARACRPRVQQESLGSRSVSYFQPDDPRSGVFLTDDELGQLGVPVGGGVGAIWTRASNGAGGVVKGPDGKLPWFSDWRPSTHPHRGGLR